MKRRDPVTVEMLRQYEAALSDFWGMHTALAQIVTEDFPNGGTPKGVTRYHLDALRDLTGRLGALVEGYDRV